MFKELWGLPEYFLLNNTSVCLNANILPWKTALNISELKLFSLSAFLFLCLPLLLVNIQQVKYVAW